MMPVASNPSMSRRSVRRLSSSLPPLLRSLQARATPKETPRPSTVSGLSSTVDPLDAGYGYTQSTPDFEGVSMAATVPAAEFFSVSYLRGRLNSTWPLIYTVVANFLLSTIKGGEAEHGELKDYERYFPPFYIFLGRLRSFFGGAPLIPSSKFIAMPAIAATYREDAVFAEQRLSGMNPVMLRRVVQDDDRAAVLLAGGVTGANSALAQGHLFVTDYSGKPRPNGVADFPLPEVIEGGGYVDSEGKPARKALPRPLAFFVWQPATKRLMPLAILLDGGPRLYTPVDEPLDWLFAKTCVQIADSNHHELNTHLAQTHFVMEPFAISTQRKLPQSHPLNVLLCPHTRFMIANNEVGRQLLINEEGPVDDLLCGTIKESRRIARMAVDVWSLETSALPADIAARGMEELPHYPYRDDGLRVWGAIEGYVREYLTVVYPDNAALEGDAALQAWAFELADKQHGGAVSGMPPSIDSLEQLVGIVTNVIFTCGPQHSAVNFTQLPYAGFVPNQPLGARGVYRELCRRPKGASITEADLCALLPDSSLAADQLSVLAFLSAYRFDRLGDYDAAFDVAYSMTTEEVFALVKDGDKLLEAVKRFQGQLAQVSREIEASNSSTERKFQYEHMLPANIINSISI